MVLSDRLYFLIDRSRFNVSPPIERKFFSEVEFDTFSICCIGIANSVLLNERDDQFFSNRSVDWRPPR